MAVTVHLTCRRQGAPFSERVQTINAGNCSEPHLQALCTLPMLNSYNHSFEYFCADRILHRHRGENGRSKQEGSPKQKEKESS